MLAAQLRRGTLKVWRGIRDILCRAARAREMAKGALVVHQWQMTETLPAAAVAAVLVKVTIMMVRLGAMAVTVKS